MKRIPRIPRPLLGNYSRPEGENLVKRAGSKNQRRKSDYSTGRLPSGRLSTTGKPSTTGWKDTRQIDKADPKPRKIAGATNPAPHGYAPSGKHRSQGTATKSHRGRRRASETGYEGRHRQDYEGRHHR